MTDAFLRIPPFPGHRAQPLAVLGNGTIDSATALEILQLLREKRVGGNFWGGRPGLPHGRDLLLVPRSHQQALEMVEAASAENLLDRCVLVGFDHPSVLKIGASQNRSSFDWWHIAEVAKEIWTDADHELALISAIAGRPVRIFGEGRFDCLRGEDGIADAVQHALGGWTYRCPFGGDVIGPDDAIERLSDWRQLIDRNRRLSEVFGIASWKRPTVDPMLWDGESVPHRRSNPSGKPDGSHWAVWKSRTPAQLLDRLLKARLPIAEIEDGFVRGRGLGANCIPPLSIVVDFSGIYFDPSQASDLENILEYAEIGEALTSRAAHLRQAMIKAGVSKYGGGPSPKITNAGAHRILVVGQVEDDRSILSGGDGQSNLELLARTRAIEPHAWIIYRPHPDVEAGHRKGHIPDRDVLRYANEIERGGAISELIDSVDEIHCITSLAGFEALLRNKKVSVHGAPFYAGWGLTNDLGSIPSRRTRRRSLDELAAAALILYPTYIDPVTGLPCKPELVIDRIAEGEDSVAAPLSGLRILQGKLKVALRRLQAAAA